MSGGGGEARAGRPGSGVRGEAGGAASGARRPAPISAVLASPTWWLCAKRRLPHPASAPGPARGLGLPLGGSAPGRPLWARHQARRPDSGLRAWRAGRGAGRAVSRLWLRHLGGKGEEGAAVTANAVPGERPCLPPRRRVAVGSVLSSDCCQTGQLTQLTPLPADCAASSGFSS